VRCIVPQPIAGHCTEPIGRPPQIPEYDPSSVAETPEELYERAKTALRTPPVEEWETWPFEGGVRPRGLAPPETAERELKGAGGVDCWACTAPDDDFLWIDDRWRVFAIPEHALPVVVLLLPRDHFANPGDLPDERAADLGQMLARVERAVRAVPDIGRVHVCRWGDGSEHLHWWFLARPARLPQLIGSFAAIWDDVLPPLPEEIRAANIALVKSALG
jgi:diadenosine tetraphosphate (Ap4A) HIT family hydrolase